MQTEKLEREFKQFLGCCGALNAYVTACNDAGVSIREVLDKNIPACWILSAFNFKNSNKGEEFWEAFDYTWNVYLGVLLDEDRKL